jgi:hypothetical protein
VSVDEPDQATKCKRRRLKAIDIDQYLAIGSEGKTSELEEMVVDCGPVVSVEQ